MSSVYPGGLDSFSTSHQDNVNEIIHAGDINNLADAVNKIEAALGIDPFGVYATVLARLNILETLSFTTPAGTAYTLQLSDASQCVVMTNSAACTLTIPNNTSVAFLGGTQILVRQGGAGAITIVGASGVTVDNPYSSFATAGTQAEVKLLKIAPNVWSVNGEVA